MASIKRLLIHDQYRRRDHGRSDYGRWSLAEPILWIARECVALSRELSPGTVTDERLTRLLLAMQKCNSDMAEEGQMNPVPDLSRIDNHQIQWRFFMSRFVREAPWLMAETKQAVIQFVMSLPSVLIREKYEITNDCFSFRIPQWRHDLARFAGAPNLRFLEIGSFEGYSACWLLDNILTHSSSHLVCIDTFEDECARFLYDLNISRTKASHRVTKRVGLSEDQLVKLEKNSFDFIYVDGSHQQVNVLQDGVLAWRLLKNGGLMTFDDYQIAEHPIDILLQGKDRPEVGINAFLTVFEGRYCLIHSGYQVTIQQL